MWSKFNNSTSVFLTKYPVEEEKWLEKDIIELPVQVNGNVKFKVEVSKELSNEKVEEVVLNDKRLERYLNGRPVKKVIVIKSKIINVVI